MSHSMRLHRIGMLLLGSTLLLAGCGDDAATTASSSTTTRISGTAATGAPIVGGTVVLTCAGGATANDTSDAQGRWSVTLAKASLPCAVQVTGGTVGGVANTQDLFSFTIGNGDTITTNLTPLTTLALAKAWGTAFDATDFAGLDDTTLDTLSNALAAAIDALVADLQAKGFILPGGDFNPFSRRFSPEAGNAYDDLLEDLKSALAAAGTDLDTLLALYGEGGSLPDAPAAGDCTSGDNKLVFTTNPADFCGFTKSASSAGDAGYYQFTSAEGENGVTYVKLTLSSEEVVSAMIENDAYAFACGVPFAACSGITANFITGGVEVTFSNASLVVVSGASEALTVNGVLIHTTTSGTGGSSEGLPATPVEAGKLGVRFAINGVVNGAEQSGAIRFWEDPFSFEDETATTFTAYTNLQVGEFLYDAFSFKNLPNTAGTHDCGDSLATSGGRNIEFSFGGGNGFSTIGTKGVTGFSCEITVTQTRIYSGGVYSGAMEGSFRARFFKTGQAVNLADSIFVSGNFRIGVLPPN